MFTIISVLSCALLLTACSSNNSQQQSSVESSSEEVSDVGNPFDTSSENVFSSLSSEEFSDVGNPFEISSDDVSSSLPSEKTNSDTSVVSETLIYKDFEYQENNEENGVTITKYIGNDANVSIPEKIYGTDVTILGDSAFAENKSIKSITVSKTVISIGNDTFKNCTNLEKVIFQENSKLFRIGIDTFFNTAISEIRLPKNCIHLGNAFTSCNNLKKIYILNKKADFSKNAYLPIDTVIYAYEYDDNGKVTEIGKYAFRLQYKLVDLGKEN